MGCAYLKNLFCKKTQQLRIIATSHAGSHDKDQSRKKRGWNILRDLDFLLFRCHGGLLFLLRPLRGGLVEGHLGDVFPLPGRRREPLNLAHVALVGAAPHLQDVSKVHPVAQTVFSTYRPN